MTTKTLNLSMTERIILANQLRILEAVDADDAERHAHLRDAIERGYELEYGHLAEPFSEGLTEAECNEVPEILEMHRALNHVQRELPRDEGIDAAAVKFRRFDGNNETELMAYAKFIRKEAKYDELGEANGFNSHRPMLERYRRMLKVYAEIQTHHRRTNDDLERENLNADEIKRILVLTGQEPAR